MWILIACLKEGQWDLFAEFFQVYRDKLSTNQFLAVLTNIMEIDFAAGEQLVDQQYPTMIIEIGPALMRRFAAFGTLESFQRHLALVKPRGRDKGWINKYLLSAAEQENFDIVNHYLPLGYTAFIPQLIPDREMNEAAIAQRNRIFKDLDSRATYNVSDAVDWALDQENEEILTYLIQKYPELDYTDIIREHLFEGLAWVKRDFFLAHEADIPYDRLEIWQEISGQEGFADIVQYYQDNYQIN